MNTTSSLSLRSNLAERSGDENGTSFCIVDGDFYAACEGRITQSQPLCLVTELGLIPVAIIWSTMYRTVATTCSSRSSSSSGNNSSSLGVATNNGNNKATTSQQLGATTNNNKYPNKQQPTRREPGAAAVS
jgi:hypothetical protein